VHTFVWQVMSPASAVRRDWVISYPEKGWEPEDSGRA